VKDTLAYLRLALNAHDDVSLRRVINGPPAHRKGVMDALEAAEPGQTDDQAGPLFSGFGQARRPAIPVVQAGRRRGPAAGAARACAALGGSGISSWT
jgi:hypothetical protein